MVLFEDQQVMAVLDTGAPYSICTPQIADIIGLKRELNDVDIRLIVAHLGEVRGYLKRMTVRFLAYEGESLDIDATAFVPDLSPEDWDSTFPSFIGLTNCLELVRFAVDPANNTFYFGATDGGI